MPLIGKSYFPDDITWKNNSEAWTRTFYDKYSGRKWMKDAENTFWKFPETRNLAFMFSDDPSWFTVSPYMTLQRICWKYNIPNPTYITRKEGEQWVSTCTINFGYNDESSLLREANSNRKKLSSAYAALKVLIQISKNVKHFYELINVYHMCEKMTVRNFHIDGKNIWINICDSVKMDTCEVAQMFPGAIIGTKETRAMMFPHIDGEHADYVRLMVELMETIVKYGAEIQVLILVSKKQKMLSLSSLQGNYVVKTAFNYETLRKAVINGRIEWKELHQND